MANSVVIFDEAQMLPGAQLRPCVAAVSELVRSFGATAVLCTATQPSLNGLFARYAPGLRIGELCPDTKTYYEAFRRVHFADAGALDADALAERLSALPQVLCVVNSRKAARDVFGRLPPKGSFHLSTLMYPAHRRAVLAEIRDRLREGLPCRVVSTSLIEAGVDVDFPAVFREKAGLDSVLQAAGRCNREGKRSREESVVTTFEGVSATPQLLQMNVQAAREALAGGSDPDAPETIRRYFDAWLSLTGDALDKSGAVAAFEAGVQGRLLPFRTVAERFHLIDDAAKTVYVPLGEGEALVKRLRAGERSRLLFRSLGQYGVSVYENHYRALLNKGVLEPIDEDGAVLTETSLYDPAMGLNVFESLETMGFLAI